MTGNRKKRKPKRLNHQRNAKKQKLEKEKTVQMTKITDLNFDCLEKIFDHLEFNDFFNVSLSNTTLQTATSSTFKRKFGVVNITLDPTNIDRSSVREGCFWICGLKSCLWIVRCFGKYFTELHLLNESNIYLDQYIQQYCAKTLTKIRFSCRSIDVNTFQKPFHKVDIVEVGKIKSAGFLSRFVNWFPNMHQLEVGDYASDVAVTIPQLEHLIVSSRHQTKYAELMHSNRQLQSIKLARQRMAMYQSLDIIDHNHAILKLEISHDYGSAVNVHPKDSMRLPREHPSLVELNLLRHQFKGNAASILIRQLNGLNMLRFVVSSQSECDDILKQLDNEWHHEIQPVDWVYSDFPYLHVKLSR